MVTETIREEVRDTIIQTEPDEALIRALIECDSLGKAHIKTILDYETGQRIKPPDVSIDDNNILTAAAKVDSMAIYLQLKDRYIERDTNQTTIKRIEVNKLTKWQKTRIRIANIVLLFIPLILAYIYRKSILTFIKKILKI